jgi:hypothetical protein
MAIGWTRRRADPGTAAAVRLRVDPPNLRDDLLEFLRAASCLAVKHLGSEIEALVLNSVSERHDRVVLNGYVESWRAGHEGASVTFIRA